MAKGSSQRWWSASRGGNRLGVSCALLVAAVVSLGAQISPVPNVTLLKSGLHTFGPGRLVVVTVVETGPAAALSEVRIEARDAAEKKRGYTIGQLAVGRPVRLRLQLAAGSSLQSLRFLVRHTLLANGQLSAPVVTVEEINTTSLTIETRPPSCAPPPGTSSGVQENCDGSRWVEREPIPTDAFPGLPPICVAGAATRNRGNVRSPMRL